MDKKTTILKSVLKLVNREGFYHLNMKKIAEEAGIAAGTIYLYYKGKEELINDLYKSIISNFNQAVLMGYKAEKSVQDNFYAMLKKALEYYLEEKDAFSFVEQYTYAPFLFKENRDENFILLLPIYKLMRQGKKEGIIKNMDDSILLSIIHGALNTIIKLHLARKTDLRKRGAIRRFQNAIWAAISN